MFYAIKDGKMYPFYNDAEENSQEKLRLDKDLNEVVIGHWKNHDNTKEYYSKVNTLTMVIFYSIHLLISCIFLIIWVSFIIFRIA